MVRRAGYIPRLPEQELVSRDHFAPVAAQRLHQLTGSPYEQLPFEELAHIAGQWYEACAYVLHFSSLVQMETFLRQETKRIGSEPELKTLRRVLGALGESYRQCGWTLETVADIGFVVEGVLADMGLVKAGLEITQPVAKPAEAAAKVAEQPAEKAGRPPRRSRAKIAMTAQVQAWESSVDILEVVQAQNVSRDGFYFYSTQPYKPGMHLRVILPYTQQADEDKMNTLAGEVARVEPGGDMPGIAVKFVRQ